jgi:hypothetical protein
VVKGLGVDYHIPEIVKASKESHGVELERKVHLPIMEAVEEVAVMLEAAMEEMVVVVVAMELVVPMVYPGEEQLLVLGERLMAYPI